MNEAIIVPKYNEYAISQEIKKEFERKKRKKQWQH